MFDSVLKPNNIKDTAALQLCNLWHVTLTTSYSWYTTYWHELMQRDVPGITRTAIPILVERGIKTLSVGVNPGSAPPGVPKCTPFIWRDPQSGKQLVAYWHPGVN